MYGSEKLPIAPPRVEVKNQYLFLECDVSTPHIGAQVV